MLHRILIRIPVLTTMREILTDPVAASIVQDLTEEGRTEEDLTEEGRTEDIPVEDIPAKDIRVVVGLEAGIPEVGPAKVTLEAADQVGDIRSIDLEVATPELVDLDQDTREAATL